MYFDTYIIVIRKRIQTTNQKSTKRLQLLITLSRWNLNWILCKQIINTDVNTDTDTITLWKSKRKQSSISCILFSIRASLFKYVRNYVFELLFKKILLLIRTNFTDTLKNLELFIILPIQVSILIHEADKRTHTFMKTKDKNDTYIMSDTNINFCKQKYKYLRFLILLVL